MNEPTAVTGAAGASQRAPRPLRLATSNPHKAEELRRLVRAAAGGLASSLAVVDLAGVAGYRPPAEDGADYRANALIKARAVAALFPGDAVLADDSGLEVRALGGAPGVRSNRWATGPAGEPLDGPGLNAALLERLRGVSPSERLARMVCEVVFVLPGPAGSRTHFGRGEVEGRIAPEARGTGGFGYDAVFLLTDGRRVSEQPSAVKDEHGHRGRAVRALAGPLRDWLERAGAPR